MQIVVQDRPTPGQLESAGCPPDETLYGLFEGTALMERTFGEEDAIGDRIVLFREPLVEDFTDPHELEDEIRRTLLHEIGHYFGLGEDELEELGYE